jgi:hypothetical protein
MAHFAEIDENNIVLRVLVVDNSQEHRGQDFLANEMGFGGTWIQTSYNRNFRGIYAYVGCLYDPVEDVFKILETEETISNADRSNVVDRPAS